MPAVQATSVSPRSVADSLSNETLTISVTDKNHSPIVNYLGPPILPDLISITVSLVKAYSLSLFPFIKGKSGFYALIFAVVFLFALASMLMQSSITSVFRQHNERNRDLRDDLKFGSSLKFVPGKISQRFLLGDGLDRLRSQPRIGVRAPRIALILVHMTVDPQSLMLVTVIQNLQKLGYVFKIFEVGHGNAHSIWENIGGGLSPLSTEQQGQIDWSNFEGIIVDSLEAKEAISRSLETMSEPFEFSDPPKGHFMSLPKRLMTSLQILGNGQGCISLLLWA